MTTADEPIPFRAAAHPLWAGLERFAFDAGAPDRPPPLRTFARRLAAKQGWSALFAARVVDEYRRFLFLAVAAGRPVCPSEEVDEAWHLHLTDTRSYWHDLCAGVLGTPLHHDASRGGAEDGRRHREMYRATLAAYREWFGADPPADIWPPAWRRFDAGHRPVPIDMADHWVIRRPRWWPRSRMARASLATVPLVAIAPLVGQGLGPFDLPGPTFLALFIGLFVAAIVASVALRYAWRDVPARDERELLPEEVACLAHGPTGAIRATLAGMLDASELAGRAKNSWSSGTRNFLLEKVADAVPIAGGIAGAIRGAVRDGGGTSLATVERDPGVVEEADALRRRLQERGWLLDDDRLWWLRWLPTGGFGLLLLFGLAKIGIGLSRGRPVEFLFLGCAVTVAAMVWAFRAPRTSLAADRLLATLRIQHATHSPGDPTDLVLMAGLFGAAALSSPHLEPYKKTWQTEAASGGSGGCGTTSGCGGGGGDGGGGCGGGCGGCGGGD
ncbi:MAG: TIGR04222 domain-containing membrane protein [Planctomycetaceae bacterium]